MWVLVTMVAAVCQTARTAAQQRLRSLLSVNGAGFVRYAYGAPIALAAVAMIWIGRGLPAIPGRFWPIVLGAGLAQIVGTNALIRAFDLRNFAIGTVYAKTEVVQVAIFSAVLLHEPLAPLGWLASALVVCGVVALVMGSPRAEMGPVADPAALMGLLAGGAFALASVAIRAANTSLGDDPAVVRALVTLAVMNTMQTVLQGAYLGWRQREQLTLAARHWRSSSVVGVLSVSGSAGWSIAFALKNAAQVRTVGQIELLLTFAVSRWWLKEHHARRDYWASALVLAGVVVMIAA